MRAPTLSQSLGRCCAPQQRISTGPAPRGAPCQASRCWSWVRVRVCVHVCVQACVCVCMCARALTHTPSSGVGNSDESYLLIGPTLFR